MALLGARKAGHGKASWALWRSYWDGVGRRREFTVGPGESSEDETVTLSGDRTGNLSVEVQDVIDGNNKQTLVWTGRDSNILENGRSLCICYWLNRSAMT